MYFIFRKSYWFREKKLRPNNTKWASIIGTTKLLIWVRISLHEYSKIILSIRSLKRRIGWEGSKYLSTLNLSFHTLR